jgi:hypothetical protein
MESECILSNASRKLEKIRDCCIHIPEEIYFLAEYIAKMLKQSDLTNVDMLNCLISALNDIKYCLGGFEEKYLEVPKELVDNRDFIFENIGIFPQLIDDISSEEYSNGFRNIFEEVLGEAAPRRKSTIIHLIIDKLEDEVEEELLVAIC